MLTVLAFTTPALADPAWPLDDRHLHAEQAWQISQGDGVLIAVVDTGVAADHPDLAGQVRTGTGFVGLAGDQGTTDVSADSHGTSVAAIIAGTGASSNGSGVKGLAPRASILPIRVSLQNDVEAGTVAQAIAYAADHGAKVINISLGTPDPDPALRAAVKYAQDRDCVIVASAGNTGRESNEPMYPASFPGVINVTGVGTDYRFWPRSQSGSGSSIAAPATDIRSANNKGQYVRTEGTSYSAAYVSATAALVRARYPQLTAAQVVRQLVDTAKPQGPHDQYGHGILDPLNAVSRAPDTVHTDNPLTAAPNADGSSSPVLLIVSAGSAVVMTAAGGWWLTRRRRAKAPVPAPIASKPRSPRAPAASPPRQRSKSKTKARRR
ncbi:type VII secretion-associated serine protease mycosin [Yinghuangia seranimata]|uniref:type VII secretion-associated serine protease mycosin n=1 Tax=Yinghuangia seranimata TaxID=408067 RepID=UPI00248B6FE3|nr:type VII secretion-associated serine protease mycosin [Yinghuangia seranimata]MDI2130544.1 type VII secretion-associated serine protease mycosin [Yinghuangia seranimata]